jgi:hypothetical protein
MKFSIMGCMGFLIGFFVVGNTFNPTISLIDGLLRGILGLGLSILMGISLGYLNLFGGKNGRK